MNTNKIAREINECEPANAGKAAEIRDKSACSKLIPGKQSAI